MTADTVPRRFRVCMYVDDVASLGSTPSSEYEGHQEDLTDRVFGKAQVTFKRGVMPRHLRDHPCDVYLIDFGGLAAQIGEGRGDLISRDLLEAVREYPDTYFLIWSSFSSRYFKGELFEALAEEVGDAAAEDLSLSDVKVPATVLLWPDEGSEDDTLDLLRRYLGLPELPPPDPFRRLARYRDEAERADGAGGEDDGEIDW